MNFKLFGRCKLYIQRDGKMARFTRFLRKLFLISFLWALSNDVPLKIVENGCETFLATDNQTTESIWCFLDFDRGLYNVLTRWHRFDYGILDRVSCQVY